MAAPKADGQGELLVATRLNVAASKTVALEDEPVADLGDTQTITLTVRCVFAGHELTKEGARVPARRMEVIHVDLGHVTPAPRDPQLALVDDVFPIGGPEE